MTDLEMERIERFANDTNLFDAVRKYTLQIIDQLERGGITLNTPDEVAGQNAKAALIARDNIARAFDVMASLRDTYTQPDEPEHV